MSAAVATAKSVSTKPGLEESTAPKQHHIRITLTSRYVSRLEAGTFLPFIIAVACGRHLPAFCSLALFNLI